MAKEASPQLKVYHKRWDLLACGEPFYTQGACLQKVIYAGRKAMLKISKGEEEKHGAEFLTRLNGQHGVRVYERDDHALLMEFADGNRSLREMSIHGNDAKATLVICNTLAALHAQQLPATKTTVTLKRWFHDLLFCADKYGPVIRQASETAKALLEEQQEVTTLHGDIHHENILHSARGWLMIDPKNLFGDRAFDYSNLFCNPKLPFITDKTVFHQRLLAVSELAEIDICRMQKWVCAWAGLSAVWMMQDGMDAALELDIARLALLLLS